MLDLQRDISAAKLFSLKKSKPRLLLVAMLCLSCVARAQSGGASVTMAGGVSKTVTLSLPEGAVVSGGRSRLTSSRNPDGSLTITLSGATRDLAGVNIPLRIRSNTAYRLFATTKAGGSNLSSLLVVDVRATGKLAASEAVEALRVAEMFDGRRRADQLTPGGGLNSPNLSAPIELLSGPLISLGGTPESPQNAVEITLRMTVEPRADDQNWTIELLLSTAPSAHF